MSIRTKKRQRVIILSSIVLGFVLLCVAGFFLRRLQVARQFEGYRREGLQAAKDGNPDLAAQLLGRYTRRHSDNTEVLSTLAEQLKLLTDGDHLRDRILILRHLTELHPDRIQDRKTLLDLYLQAGLNAEADTLSSQLLAINAKDQDALRAKALAKMRLRQFDDALKLARQFNTAFPNDIEAQIMTLMIMRGKNVPAADILAQADKLLQAFPSDSGFQLVKSTAFAITDNLDQAQNWSRKAAINAPADPALLKLLVKEMESLQLFEESKSLLERAYKANPASQDLQQLLVTRIFQLNHWQQVVDLTANLSPPAKNATDAELLAMRAVSLLNLNQTQDAQSIIEGLGKNKTNPDAIVWGKVLSNLNEKEPRKAVDACNLAVSRSYSDPYFHYFLAKSLLRASETDQAVTNFGLATKLAPAWNLPLLDLCRLLTAAGRGADALILANQARTRDPSDLQAMIAVATAMATSTPIDQAGKHRELLDLVEQIQKRSPGEEQTLPIQILMLVQLGQRERAFSIINNTLTRNPPASEASLLQLSATCRQFDPKLQDRCLTRCQEIYGVTPDLTMTRARNLFSLNRTTEGLKLIEDAIANPHKGDELSWSIVHARYLDFIEDPRAKNEWVALAEKNQDNSQIQWLAISARSVQNDHAFIGQTLDRLEKLVGNEGTAWRLARARWLLSGNGGTQDVSEAAALLTEVSRSSPELLAPHLLLAESYERSRNYSGAIEQLMSASALDPQSNNIALELIRLLQKQGDYDRAKPYLDRMLASKSMTSGELRKLAALLAQRGETAKALELETAVYGSDPAHQPADLVLAGLYRMHNQTDLAETIYKKLLEKPDTAIIAITAGFYAETGRIKQAKDLLTQLDKLEPNVATREVVLGDFSLQHETADIALQHYRNATTAAPTNATAWRRLINVQLTQGKSADAISSARAAIAAIKQDTLLADFLRHQPLIEQADQDPSQRSFLISLLSSDESDSAACYEVLNVLAQAKKENAPLEQTVIKLRPLADRYPRLLPLQSWVAQAYAMTKNIDDAVNIGTRTMRTFPNSPEPAQISAAALAEAGRWNEVLQVAKDWRQRLPSNPLPADQMIAAAYLGTGDANGAIQQLQPYLKSALASPNNYTMLLNLYAGALILRGEDQVAANLLRPLLPKSESAQRLWISIASKQLKDVKEASAWLREVEPYASNSGFITQISFCGGWHELSLRANDPNLTTVAHTKALVLAQKTATAKDATPLDLQVIAILLDDQGEKTQAEAFYRKALKQKADLPISQNNLAMILVRNGGDLNEAVQLANQAVQNNPTIPNFADTLATVYEQMKDFNNAITSITKAVQVDPNRPDWQVHLTEILAESGQVDKAKAALGKLNDSLATGNIPPSLQDRLTAVRKRLGVKT